MGGKLYDFFVGSFLYAHHISLLTNSMDSSIYILPFAFALTPPRCYFSRYEIIYNNNLKKCEVLTLLLSIIFLKNGRDLHSPCVPVISGASFSKEKNLRKVVGYPLSKSCNFSVAHSLCVFDRAWLLEISESSGLDERGAPSSIICPFLF